MRPLVSSGKVNRVGIFSGRHPWQICFVVLYAVLIFGGISQVHRAQNGKPAHSHAADSDYAELSENTSEFKAEIARLATVPDLVTPYIEVTSAHFDFFHRPSFSFLPEAAFSLRGPPSA